MGIGMFASAAISFSIVQVTWDEALIQYPVQVLARHGGVDDGADAGLDASQATRLEAIERDGAAMVVPVNAFICLVLFDVTKGALCSLYCVATISAMLGVMYYRRSDYSGDHSLSQ